MKTRVTLIMSYMLFFISFLMIQVIFQMNVLKPSDDTSYFSNERTCTFAIFDNIIVL